MDKASLNEKTKRVIRSLLTSNPCNMTIRSLAKDYRVMVDVQGIPYGPLGYNSLEHYLKSIPDVVQVQGSGLEADLVPVVTPKNSHINELVVKQKIGSKRNVPPQQRRRRPHIKPSPAQLEVQHSESYEFISSSSDLETAAPTVDKCKKYETKAVVTVSDVENRMQKCLEEACRQSAEQVIGVPKAVKSQLSSLMLRYPQGIWCRDLPKVFFQHYGKQLNFQQYGYTNLIDMVSKLDTIFQDVQLEMGDFLLFHANQSIPEDILIKSGQIDEGKLNESVCLFDNLQTDKSRQLTYPKNVLSLGRKIKGLTASKLAKEKGRNAFDAIVTQVYSPYNIWLYLKESPLDELTKDMVDFFSTEGDTYKMPASHFIDGMYCVKLIDNQCYRTLIKDSKDNKCDHVLAFFIDYGVQVLTKKEDFYFLPEQFANIKAQAVRCALSNVFPIPAFEPWSEKAKDHLRNLVNAVDGREFQVLIKKVCPDNGSCHFDVELSYRDKNKAVVNLRNKFVNAGYAQTGDDLQSAMNV